MSRLATGMLAGLPSLPARMRSEGLISLCLFFLSGGFGMTYVVVWGEGAQFYQRDYGPAVMVAAGRGFVNPTPSAIPGLEEFLAVKANSLDMRDIPSEVSTIPLNRLQANWFYMLYTVGLLWRVFGISWSALLPLYGILFGLTSVAYYALFRVGCGRGWALAGALLLTLSPFNLFYLPGLRDYSKVPFIILTIAVLGYLVKKDLPWKGRFFIAVALGAILGFGLGWRKDVITCVPPALLVFAALLPGNPWRQKLRRGALILAFMAAFILVAWPLLAAMRQKGGTTSHVLLLGLMQPYDDALGVGEVPYTFGEKYNDAYVYNMVKSYWQRHGEGQAPPLTLEYDHACNDVYRWFVREFPADMLLRWYASSCRILDYGPFFTEGEARDWTPNPFVHALFLDRWRLLGWLSGFGVLLSGVCLFTLGALRVRYALAYLFLVLYFTGYASLQFSQRHFFHLECGFWWPILFLLAGLTRPTTWRRCAGDTKLSFAALPSRLRSWMFPTVARRLGIVATVLAGVTVLPLSVARACQAREVSRLYERYRQLTLAPLPVDALEKGGSVWLKPREWPSPLAPGDTDPDRVRDHYLVAEFSALEPIPIWTQYESADKFNNFSQGIKLPRLTGSDQTLRYFFPVYESAGDGLWGNRDFLGILLPKRFYPYFKGMYRVADLHPLGPLFPLEMQADDGAMARYSRYVADPIPFYPRARRAAHHNLVTNGSFETWPSNATPLGFEAPSQAATIQRETTIISSGHYAVREAWDSPPGPTAVGQRFRTQPLFLEPCATYELFVDGYNCSRNTIVVSAWQVTRNASSQEELTRLSPAVVEFKPANSYLTVAGQFTTTLGESPAVVLAIDCAGDAYPAVCYLDNVRLTRLE